MLKWYKPSISELSRQNPSKVRFYEQDFDCI